MLSQIGSLKDIPVAVWDTVFLYLRPRINLQFFDQEYFVEILTTTYLECAMNESLTWFKDQFGEFPTARDKTSRKKLRQQYAKYRNIILNMPDIEHRTETIKTYVAMFEGQKNEIMDEIKQMKSVIQGISYLREHKRPP